MFRLAAALALAAAPLLLLATATSASDLPGPPTTIDGSIEEMSFGKHLMGPEVDAKALKGKVVLVEIGGL